LTTEEDSCFLWPEPPTMRRLFLPFGVAVAAGSQSLPTGLLVQASDCRNSTDCSCYAKLQCGPPVILKFDCDETCAACATGVFEDEHVDDFGLCGYDDDDIDVDLICDDDVLKAISCSTGHFIREFPDGLCVSLSV